MKTINDSAINAAGTTPVTKNVATDKVVIDASTIITRLGGMVSPMIPAEANTAVLSAGG